MAVWLQLLLELMTLVVPVEGAVTSAIAEVNSKDTTGNKIVNIVALAERILSAAKPMIDQVTK